MRTCEERIYLIQKRTEEIKLKNHKRKQLYLDAAYLTVCFLLISCLGIMMPGLAGSTRSNLIVTSSGTASILVSQDALSYIMIGLLSFFLGMCVTILLYRLRKKNKYVKKKDDEHGEF